jgi:hypothetical protein
LYKGQAAFDTNWGIDKFPEITPWIVGEACFLYISERELGEVHSRSSSELRKRLLGGRASLEEVK